MQARLLLLFMLFFQLAFSTDITDPGVFWAIFPATALIVVSILALGMMISDAFNMPHLKAWVKVELREFIIGVIICIIVLSIFSTTPWLVNALSSRTDEGTQGEITKEEFIDSVTKTLSSFRDEYLISQYKSIIKIDHELTLLSGYSYMFPLGFLYFSYTDVSAPFTGFGGLLSIVGQATAGLSNAIIVYNATIVLIQFFMEAAVLLLPFALALRLIPFTRQLGSTMIALCLGAYIFFPFSVYLVSQFHQTIDLNKIKRSLSSDELSKIHIDIPLGFDEVCNNTVIKAFAIIPEWLWGFIICIPACIIFALFCGPGFAGCFSACGPFWKGACWSLIADLVYPIIVSGFQVFYGLPFYIKSKVKEHYMDAGVIYDVIHGFLKDVNNTVLVSYIDVLIIGIITYVGTKSISTALGGEYLLPAIQKLI